jgi:hypothetical protein
VVTDGDGDTTSDTIDLGSIIKFEDDGPSYISPDTLHLENKGVVGPTDQITAALNFVPGSDGVGNVVFNVPGVVVGVVPPAQGLLAEDSAGNDLKVGGQQLYLYYGGLDGTDTTILVAKTLAGVVGFTIDIDPVTGTYIYNQEAPISNGTEISATDLTGVGGGNPEFKLLINIGGTTQDVAMTTSKGNSVNSDNDDIGISQGQTFETGESLRFDLVNGLKVDGGTVEGYSYDGTRNLTNRWKQLIQITGSKTENADFIVSAIVADGDNQFFGDTEPRIDLSVANINIYDDKGSLIDPANWAGKGITVTDEGLSIKITGLLDDYSYEIVTAPADKFSAIQVDAIAGTDNFSLGFFSYGENNAGSSIDLSYLVDGTDGDGDKTSSTIDVSLYPDATSSSGTSFAGTAANETFLGTQGADGAINGAGGNDVLAGNAGADTINGGDGNDKIIGGSGNDILSGGANSDIFVFETLVDGKDSISDFSILAPAAGGDVLDVSQVLNHSGNTWADGSGVAAAITGEYLTFTNVGGFVQVNVDIDGKAGSNYASTPIAILTTVAFVDPATDLADNIKVD